MKFKIKSNNNNINNSIIFVVINNYILYISISMLSLLMVSADEENPKSNNSSNIFKQTKTGQSIIQSSNIIETKCLTFLLLSLQYICYKYYENFYIDFSQRNKNNKIHV